MSTALAFPSLIRPLKFYAVVPTAHWVQRLVAAGANSIQLRNKQLSGAALEQEIAQSIAAVKGSNSQLFINDYWQQALKLSAYGIHLGQEDLVNADLAAIAKAGIRLGISTHSDQELDKALALQPSYVACGAIFPTTTKVMPTAPQGLERLESYVRAAGTTPTVAIGGINLDNAAAVLATGVSSIAVVRAITEAPDTAATVTAFQALFVAA